MNCHPSFLDSTSHNRIWQPTQSATFYCGKSKGVPVKFARTQDGRKRAIIHWTSNVYFPLPWTAQRRCVEVSRRFQRSYDISLVLEKALEQGYQVGYTNRLEKGMSGRALLNKSGEVVGVNGMHAYPLWDVPSVFMDGEQAEEKLHQQIIRLSWAVPIDQVIQNIGKLKMSNSDFPR